MRSFFLSLALILAGATVLVPNEASAVACGIGLPACPSTQYCDGVLFNSQCRNRGGSTASCTGLGQGTCLAGLVCDTSGECRQVRPALGEVCGAAVCQDGLACINGRCTTIPGVGDTCGVGLAIPPTRGNCGPGLLCDYSNGLLSPLICRNDPPQAGQTCGVLAPCAGTLTCFNSKCESPRAAGQTCDATVANSCQPGLLCEGTPTAICRSPGTAGAVCGVGLSCASGLVCDVSGVCRNNPPIQGQPCGGSVICASPYACNAVVGGTCQNRRSVGQSCAGVPGVNTQSNCNTGLICDGGDFICRNNPPLAGQTCGALVPCSSGLTCFNAKCEAPRAAGQTCDQTQANSCQPGLLCEGAPTAVCRSPGAAGAVCGVGLSCAGGLVCDVSGVCRNDPPTQGQPCGTGVTCASPLACTALVGGTCQARRPVGQSCAGVPGVNTQANCEAGLICDGGSFICRNDPPRLGQTCGALVPCDASLDLVCVAAVCAARGGANEACTGIGNATCKSGLVCDLGSGKCRSDPPQKGEACGGFVGCAAPLVCHQGTCTDQRTIGEVCEGLGRGNCVETAACINHIENNALVPRCFPGENVVIDDVICRAFYTPALSTNSALSGQAQTYGYGAAFTAIAGASVSKGVAYGPQGEFGCLVEACTGFASDVGATASVCTGNSDQFAAIAGPSEKFVASVDYTIPGFPSVGYGTAINRSPGGQYQGQEVCLQVGVGINPLPLTVGRYQCNTTMNPQATSLDSNGDGLQDYVSLRLGLNPLAPGGDTDGDGANDFDEVGNVDRPRDTDFDGVIDALEPFGDGTSDNDATNVPLPDRKSVSLVLLGSSGFGLRNVAGSAVPGTLPDVAFPLGAVSFRGTSGGGPLDLFLNFREDLPLCPGVFSIDYQGQLNPLPASAWSKLGPRTIRVILPDGVAPSDLDNFSGGVTNNLAVGAYTADNDGNGQPDACEIPRDSDGDGVPDTLDNCLLVPNPDQRDTNGDGYGNRCDADFNNNGIVDSQDGALLKAAFGSTAFPDRDLNGNGIVDSQDGAILKASFGKPPGPSGLRP